MGIAYNPKIITDGLVLALDAGNKKSYPGSGTTWNDLSGRNNNGTLTNGPIFDADKGGNIIFDGTDDYSLHSDTGLSASSSKTVLAMVYPTSTRSLDFARVVNHMPDSTNRFVLTLDRATGSSTSQFSIAGTPNNNASNIYGATNEKFDNNNWYYLGWTFDGTTFLAYCNGKSYSINDQSQGTYGFTGTSGLLIGSRTDVVYKFKGNISQVHIYNRALSNAEIQQNFNATRGRYGI